ncbi:hypothetical protein HUU59_08290 [bacterium]|nr:hypothetical protein [bacterium]
MNKQPDEESAGDAVHTVTKAALSAIPIVGGPVQVLFESIFTAPLEKRKAAWLNELAGVVKELEARIDEFTPDMLSNNEDFISAVMLASQIALRNHQVEKLAALRNAVFNSALPSALDFDTKMVFLRLIDDLTPTHLKILKFLRDPRSWIEVNKIAKPNWSMGGVSTVLELCLPEMKGKRDIYDRIVHDLQAEGLLSQGGFLHGTMTEDGMLASRISGFGAEFLAYITQA